MDAGILKTYPEVNEHDIDEILKREISEDPYKIVVLDDDPTGVQTVHNISVYTDWSIDSIRAGFAENNKVFYILTNSRGMSRDETAAVHKEIGKNVAEVSKETNIPYLFMSRSDSTLRGHYPLETELLKESMEMPALTWMERSCASFLKKADATR